MERVEQNFSLDPLIYLNDEGVECIEQWLPVKGFEGYYEVSDLGRFKSVERDIVRHNGVIEKKPNKILKNLYYSNGYIQCMFYVNKKRYTYIAHRVVAEHFIPNPDNLPLVNHKNFRKDDNRVSNLEWCTRSHNVLHMIEGGKHNHRALKGEEHPHTKLTDEDVVYIRNNYKYRKNNDQLYELFKDKIGRSGFDSICYGDSWKHITKQQEP